MKRFGIFGGTFNPPHIAHSIVADSVREELDLDKIIFIPSGIPPLKESIPAEHRLIMAKLAFESDKNFEVSDIEMNNVNVKSYTVNTLQRLKEIYSNASVELYLIIGIDNLIEFPKWKEPEKLFSLAQIVVINRPNFTKGNAKQEFIDSARFIDVPWLEISSSEIRAKVEQNRSIKYLVDEEVEKYIKDNDLYKSI